MNVRGKILLLITLIDSFVTGCGVKAGWLRELNPIMSWLISHAGVFWFILFRAMFVLLLIARLDRKSSTGEYGRQVARYYYNVAIITYAGIFLVPWTLVNIRFFLP